LQLQNMQINWKRSIWKSINGNS